MEWGVCCRFLFCCRFILELFVVLRLSSGIFLVGSQNLNTEFVTEIYRKVCSGGSSGFATAESTG